jgi:hypothetical protein
MITSFGLTPPARSAGIWTIIDGHGTPEGWQQGLNQAIALKVDGIVTNADRASKLHHLGLDLVHERIGYRHAGRPDHDGRDGDAENQYPFETAHVIPPMPSVRLCASADYPRLAGSRLYS